MPAIWALLPDPSHDPIFLRMLADPSVRRRRIAAARYYANPDALPALLEALRDTDLRVRRDVLSSIRRPEALAALVKLLDEDEPAIADSLSYALARLGDDLEGGGVEALVLLGAGGGSFDGGGHGSFLGGWSESDPAAGGARASSCSTGRWRRLFSPAVPRQEARAARPEV